MGRVLAHEMYHMLAKDKHHTASGVTRESLSARDLTRDEVLFSTAAVESIVRRLRTK